MVESRTERRERYRAWVRGEIKGIALARIARDGAAQLTLTGVAKEMGVSGPALYKYFASRDDLLAELVVDSHADLGDVLRSTATATATAGAPARARLHAVATAYRDWAVTQPHRYLLLAGAPVPRDEAAAGLVGEARAILDPLVEILAAGRERPLADDLRAHVSPRAGTGVNARDVAMSDPLLAGAVTAWVRLHGVVGLEALGLFAGMNTDPATVLRAEIDALADALGLG